MEREPERNNGMKTIGIAGGGAAGLFAAVGAAAAAPGDTRILLWEKNPFCGKKIRITGKGRCNVTNDCTVAEAEEKIVRGGKFLRTALYRFSPADTRRFFEDEGVPLKVERGGRVFPVSDRAADIAEALIRKAESFPSVRILHGAVQAVRREENGSFTVRAAGEETKVDRLILACGGASYPGCGSTGDGYRFAASFGHRISALRATLVPLVTRENVTPLAGLSPKNVVFTVKSGGKTLFSEQGEMLFTHFGVSGPLVLSASACLNWDVHPVYDAFIDWKPALSPEVLDARVQRDFAQNANRDLIRGLDALLPRKMIPFLVEKSGIDPRKKIHSVTREERLRLVSLLKAYPLTLTGARPIEEAIVTRGGVPTDEADPRTMESRLCPGLYFAGEVLDADALTGGYNLQIAFSTGRLAGESAARSL